MAHPDKKYIDALLTNDEKLLKEFYHKCFGKIKNFVTNNHGTSDDAWDVLQEAMLSVFYKLKQNTFKLSCPFDAFIYIVCRNLWIKELRKKRPMMVTTELEMGYYIQEEDEMVLAEACKQQNDRRKLLLEKLNELGEGCRQLLIQNWNGTHLNTIAATLNITYGYARKKKANCMAKLVWLMRQAPQYDDLKW